MSDYDTLILKNGGRRDFWLSHVDIVGRYIKKLGRDVVQINTPVMSPVASKTKASTKAIIWDPTRGGMRMPHLHYEGEIYILNEKQWASFSKMAMKSLTNKLAKVQKVGFEDVMQISEIVANI